jgi:hypothetical protein
MLRVLYNIVYLQNFHLQVTPSDRLEFTVRDKRSGKLLIFKHNHFLGRLVLDIRPFLEQPGRKYVEGNLLKDVS